MNRKGSFTIEAAFLMPIVLFIVLLVIQISFFLYNREAATVMVSQAALMGVQMEQDGKHTIQKVLSEFLEDETKKRLLFADESNWEISVTLTSVKVELSLSQKTVIKQLDYKITKKLSRLNPASLLWETERWKK